MKRRVLNTQQNTDRYPKKYITSNMFKSERQLNKDDTTKWESHMKSNGISSVMKHIEMAHLIYQAREQNFFKRNDSQRSN